MEKKSKRDYEKVTRKTGGGGGVALAAAQTNPDESTFDEPGKKVGTSNWTRKKSVPPMTSAMVMDTKVNRHLEPDQKDIMEGRLTSAKTAGDSAEEYYKVLKNSLEEQRLSEERLLNQK